MFYTYITYSNNNNKSNSKLERRKTRQTRTTTKQNNNRTIIITIIIIIITITLLSCGGGGFAPEPSPRFLLSRSSFVSNCLSMVLLLILFMLFRFLVFCFGKQSHTSKPKQHQNMIKHNKQPKTLTFWSLSNITLRFPKQPKWVATSHLLLFGVERNPSKMGLLSKHTHTLLQIKSKIWCFCVFLCSSALGLWSPNELTLWRTYFVVFWVFHFRPSLDWIFKLWGLKIGWQNKHWNFNKLNVA